VFEDVEFDPGALRRQGEDWPTAIDRICAAAAALRGEVMRIKTAPPPRSVVEAAITREVDASAPHRYPWESV
jgi:hypothetical protein